MQLCVTQAKEAPERSWPAGRSNVVLQQSVRNLDQALRNWWTSLRRQRKGAKLNPHHFKTRHRWLFQQAPKAIPVLLWVDTLRPTVTPSSPQSHNTSFPLRCLSLDLEVNQNTSRIRAFGAVRSDTGQAASGGGSGAELSRLDMFAEGVDALLGHNLIAFDIPHLAAAVPHLGLLKLPQVDTLHLSPLAFARNP